VRLAREPNMSLLPTWFYQGQLPAFITMIVAGMIVMPKEGGTGFFELGKQVPAVNHPTFTIIR